MSGMKYIRFEEAGLVIFEEQITHADMARKFPNDTPLSAGFFNLVDPDGCHLFGESVSLNLKSIPADKKRFIRKLNGY